MSKSSDTVVNPKEVVDVLVRFRGRWVIPTVVITIVAIGYAMLRTPMWVSTQALVLRDEAVGKNSRLGHFDNLESMKTAQETVLELAKSRSVLESALVTVGPADGNVTTNWPSSKDIAKLRKSIKITPPGGAEFGRTEVFYLVVESKNRLRAAELTAAICDQLDVRLARLRDSKAQSLVEELNKSVELARSDLETATTQLVNVERAVGSDLAELRILNESTTGESNLRQSLIAVKNELRQAVVEQETNERLLQLLKSAQSDPGQLVATPNHLLQAHPALQLMKNGLVDAQLRTDRLMGELSPEHPRVQAAIASQDQISNRLHAELASAIRGIEVQLDINQSRINSLKNERDEVTARMTKIASVRATYANLVTAVQNRTHLLHRAEQDLSDAKASQQAAHMSSLLSRIDRPNVGDDPVGPRKAMIVLVGLFGGLATGFGIVFLTVPFGGPSEPVATVEPAVEDTVAPQPISRIDNSRSRIPASRSLSLKQALMRVADVSLNMN